MDKKVIHQLAKEFAPEIIDVRRHLHQYPELSFQEKETGAFISELLSSWGIHHSKGWGGHGVVAILEGGEEGPTIGLRADIDALPILEKNDHGYQSKNEGIMHACGHDVHTASLLGAIKILNERKQHWGGKIKCVFQPGEEKLPGGASILIKEGVLEDPSINCMIGQHVHPPLAAGKVGFCSGEYMASADEIYVSVKGKGGHGALPHNVVDPVLVTSHMLIALQQIISRNADPLTPSVLSFGKINTVGGATNVIPNEVKLEGTFRTFDENWRSDAHEKMIRMAQGIAESMGATCEFNIVKGYPSLLNDPMITEKCREAAIDFLGEERVVVLPKRTTAEDFSFYSRLVPSCFYRLGTGNVEKGITSPVHTDTFDIDEYALTVSIGLMSYLALNALRN